MSPDNSKDEVPVGTKLAMPKAATRTRINSAGLAPAPHQVDGERHRCIEVRSSFVTGMPGFDMGHHTFTQVV